MEKRKDKENKQQKGIPGQVEDKKNGSNWYLKKRMDDCYCFHDRIKKKRAIQKLKKKERKRSCFFYFRSSL